MSRTLYVTDLDGTLLNKRDRINQASIDIINELVKKGMLFTYATAVPLAVIIKPLDTIGAELLHKQ